VNAFAFPRTEAQREHAKKIHCEGRDFDLVRDSFVDKRQRYAYSNAVRSADIAEAASRVAQTVKDSSESF